MHDVWRGDGHITLSDGSVIDIGVTYRELDPFSDHNRMPVSPAFLTFEDGSYTVTDIWQH